MQHILIDPQAIPEFIEWAHEILDPDDIDLPEECDCHYKKRLARIRMAFMKLFVGNEELSSDAEQRLMNFFLRILPMSKETLVDLNVDIHPTNKRHLVLMIVNED